MKDFVSKNKRITFFLILTSALIFIPLFLGINSFFQRSADELINSWYESEKTNIQQGNILSAVTKLQRSIEKSVLLKAIKVNDQKGLELLSVGKEFDYQKISIMTSSPALSKKRIGVTTLLYTLTDKNVNVHILIQSYLPLLTIFVMLIYLTGLFSVFAYFIRRESLAVEKLKNERALDEINLRLENDRNFFLLAHQVAHDIRSPLATLNAVNESLRASANENSQMQALVENSILRINAIANDILQKKPDQNNLVELKNENLLELIQNISHEKSLFSGNKIIEIDEASLQNIKIPLKTHEFFRVCSNLINNALEAIDKNSGKVKIYGKKETNFFRLTIEDNGKGIPANILNRIGERGFSYNKSDSAAGSGLGVFHAKQTMDLQGGYLEISSEVGIGTKVHLFLKQDLMANNNLIILFEDDELVQATWKFQAKKKNVQLLIFKNLPDFFKAHATESFIPSTLIFSDVHLENNSSGMDIVHKLYQLGFTNLNLCTGSAISTIAIPDFIKTVRDKSFPS